MGCDSYSKKMEDKIRNFRKATVVYIIVVALILAVFSVISDNIPYQTENSSALDLTLYVLGGTINNLAIWFLFAMLTGYRFGLSWTEAMAAGAILTLFAITLYFLIDTQLHPEIEGGSLRVILIWYLASALGGVTGGAVGFLARKRPVAWLIPIGFIVVQVARHGVHTWQSPLGMFQNILLILVALTIGFYAYRARR